MRFWSRPEHEPLEETRRWLADLIEPEAGSDDFLIEHGGTIIGKAGALQLPEIGFLLHPDNWGKGLAHKALVALIANLFTAHDLAELTAEVDPRNAASLRLLARLGFVETGRATRTLLWRDEWTDSIYFALPRPG